MLPAGINTRASARGERMSARQRAGEKHVMPRHKSAVLRCGICRRQAAVVCKIKRRAARRCSFSRRRACPSVHAACHARCRPVGACRRRCAPQARNRSHAPCVVACYELWQSPTSRACADLLRAAQPEVVEASVRPSSRMSALLAAQVVRRTRAEMPQERSVGKKVAASEAPP